MQLTAKHLEYWHKNLRLTVVLLVIWFLVTFVMSYFARELNFWMSIIRSQNCRRDSVPGASLGIGTALQEKTNHPLLVGCCRQM